MKKISLQRLEKWKNKKDSKNLLYALKVGTWDTRIKASEFLSEFNDLAIKESLFLGLLDSVDKVIENIKIALQNFNLSEEENEKIDLIIKSKYDKEKEKLLNELIAISKIKDKQRPIEVKKPDIKSEIKKPMPKASLKKEDAIKETKKLIEVVDKEQKKWFYRKRKEQIGPITFNDLKNLIKTGQVSFSDYVWTTGLQDWLKVEEVNGLSDVVNIKSLPPEFVKENKFIKQVKSKSVVLFSKFIGVFKNQKRKLIGIPIVILILLSSFTFFYNIKVTDGTTSTCNICIGTGIDGDKCSICEGEGKVTSKSNCNRCNGRGNINCTYSFGVKTTYFLVAKRESIYKCNNGRVYTDGIDKVYNGDNCKNCNGRGTVTCNKCGGNGKVNSLKKCTACNNGITNEKDCSECKKTGIVPNYEEFTLYEKYILPLFNGNEKPIAEIKPLVNGKYPQASTRLLITSDLENLSKDDLRIMRNEIFARHGHIYKSGKLGDYFKTQEWYKGTVKNASSLLTEIEKKNVQLILKYE